MDFGLPHRSLPVQSRCTSLLRRRALNAHCNCNCNYNCTIKEEKPVVTLIQTLLLREASTIQVTRHHDQMTRFLMITLIFHPSK